MPARKSSLIGFAAISIAAILWGTTGTIQSLLPAARDPLAVGAMRVVLGALGLAILAQFMGQGVPNIRVLPRKRVVIAGFAMAAYNALFFFGVEGSGVAFGTLLALGSAPLWVGVFQALIQRDLPNRRQFLGQLCAIAGGAAIILNANAINPTLWGLICAGGAGFAYALYTFQTAQMPANIGVLSLSTWVFATAAIFISPVFIWVNLDWVFSARAISLIALLGFGATAAAYGFFTWGLRRVELGAAVTFTLIEPLSAFLLAITIVGEKLTFSAIIGAVVLMLGLLVISLPSKSK